MGIVLKLIGLALTVVGGVALICTRTRARDYAILDIDPSASASEVKRAYRELVQVWHPDRFVHDPRLQRKAQEKLQAINDAYARLCGRAPGPAQ